MCILLRGVKRNLLHTSRRSTSRQLAWQPAERHIPCIWLHKSTGGFTKMQCVRVEGGRRQGKVLKYSVVSHTCMNEEQNFWKNTEEESSAILKPCQRHEQFTDLNNC